MKTLKQISLVFDNNLTMRRVAAVLYRQGYLYSLKAQQSKIIVQPTKRVKTGNVVGMWVRGYVAVDVQELIDFIERHRTNPKTEPYRYDYVVEYEIEENKCSGLTGGDT